MEHPFLVVNSAIVILLVVSAFWLRRNREPKAEGESQTQKVPLGWANYSPRRGGVAAPSPEVISRTFEASLSEDLSQDLRPSAPIYFQWNGHTFEVHEILGVIVGADRATIDDAFQRAATQADLQTLPFLEAARQALLSARKS